MLTVEQAKNMSDAELAATPLEERLQLLSDEAQERRNIIQANQILFYKPVSPEAERIHYSTAREVPIVGGNRSSKTDSVLADTVICMTGIIPFTLEGKFPKEKVKCPMRVRLVCESLTNTWEPVIKPKLQWWQWNGRGAPGTENGHWGWIPKRFLIKGEWASSWSEKIRTLTLTCGCTLQVNSYDQDPSDFAGSSLHRVLHDEGPPKAIYRENRMRTLDVAGQCFIQFTPPDDESASFGAAWVYEELYSKGLPGPGKDPDIDSFTLFTEDNRILDKEDIQQIMKGLTPVQKEVRLRGAFMHLGGRIYKSYTDRPQMWCFQCNDVVLVEKKACLTCQSTDVASFCHLVDPDPYQARNPCIFLMDPHPRKPVMMSWVCIDPYDDWWQVAELEVDGEPIEVRDKVFDLERNLALNVNVRIIDPNMGRSPAHSAGRRHVTVAEEFAAVGLRCNDRVSDDFNVGRIRIQQRLKPDPRTKQPRFHVASTCPLTNSHFKKFTWAEWRRYTSDEKDPKGVPREKFDDFPKLIGYLANLNPTHSGLKMGMLPFHKQGRRGGY